MCFSTYQCTQFKKIHLNIQTLPITPVIPRSFWIMFSLHFNLYPFLFAERKQPFISPFSFKTQLKFTGWCFQLDQTQKCFKGRQTLPAFISCSATEAFRARAPPRWAGRLQETCRWCTLHKTPSNFCGSHKHKQKLSQTQKQPMVFQGEWQVLANVSSSTTPLISFFLTCTGSSIINSLTSIKLLSTEFLLLTPLPMPFVACRWAVFSLT